MSEQHGLPQELPPAYVPPAYIAPASALDQPALGIVLVFAALMALPQASTMLVQMLVLDRSPEWSFVALTGLMCGSALLQLAAGLAIAWRWRWRELLFVAYVACGAVLVVCVFALWRHELGSTQAAVIALETLGGPLTVVIAPRIFGLTRISHGHALGGLLVVSGISTLLFQPVYVYFFGTLLADGHASVGSWVSSSISPAVALAVATLAIWTGVRMARGLPARRWLLAYVITALVGGAGFQLVEVVYWVFDTGELHLKYLLVQNIISLAIAVARPLIVWEFAKREPEPVARIDAALPWIALWFVPQLAARCLLRDEVEQAMGDAVGLAIVLLCAAQGIACLVAARASLRAEGGVLAWLVAAAIAAVTLGVVVYCVFSVHPDGRPVYPGAMMSLVVQAVPPVALLFATMATGAWLARRVTSAR